MLKNRDVEQMERAESLYEKIMDYREKVIGPDAVSYTHLDVYKRQGWTSGRDGDPKSLAHQRLAARRLRSTGGLALFLQSVLLDSTSVAGDNGIRSSESWPPLKNIE